jgi:hypothetical protein
MAFKSRINRRWLMAGRGLPIGIARRSERLIAAYISSFAGVGK